MAYDQQLANRIRTRLADLPNVEEKAMMGGLCFMYNDKMCVGIFKNELMCRIDPEIVDDALNKQGTRQMDMNGRTMKGYILVDETGMHLKKDFDYWIELCLDFNSRAKSSRRKRKDDLEKPNRPNSLPGFT